ncbi:MAG TPA: cytochrome C oxidase subunit IV family protein [Sulfuricella sp.]|nr:cytochrome C oxidase subunit IV family protein [Sulfuricella sp.]
MNTPPQPRFVRPCTRVWLALVTLTLVTYSIGEAGLGGKNIMLLVLAITLLKSQMIASYFMGLRKTSPMWRIIMGSWLVIVGGMIASAYLMGLQ